MARINKKILTVGIVESVSCGVFLCKEIRKIWRLQSVIKERGRGDVRNGCRTRHHCFCIQVKASSYQDIRTMCCSLKPRSHDWCIWQAFSTCGLLSVWWGRRTCANIGHWPFSRRTSDNILHTWKESPVSWRKFCCFSATGWKDKVFSWVSHVVCSTGVSLFATYTGRSNSVTVILRCGVPIVCIDTIESI